MPRTTSPPRYGRGRRRPYKHHDLGFVVDLGGTQAAANPVGVPLRRPAGQGGHPRLPPAGVARQPNADRRRLAARRGPVPPGRPAGPGTPDSRDAGMHRLGKSGGFAVRSSTNCADGGRRCWSTVVTNVGARPAHRRRACRLEPRNRAARGGRGRQERTAGLLVGPGNRVARRPGGWGRVGDGAGLQRPPSDLRGHAGSSRPAAIASARRTQDRFRAERRPCARTVPRGTGDADAVRRGRRGGAARLHR